MNVNYLIEQLTLIRDEIMENGGNPDDIEVRLAHQPNWPLEFEMGDVVLVDMNAPDEDDEDEAEAEEPKYMVYIGEGRQEGYLPGVVATELGWGRGR